MAHSRFYTILILALMMSVVCKPQASEQRGQGDSSPISAHSLMTIAFPQSHEGKWQMMLPLGGTGKPENFELEALMCSPLASDWMVLIANAFPSPGPSHANPGSLNILWFKQVKGAWKIVAHEKNIAEMGSFGNMGTLNFHTFPGGRLVLSVEGGGTWQGQTVGWLNLFELIPEHSRQLIEPLRLLATNSGDCPSSGTCFSITGTWSSAPSSNPASDPNYPDLVIQFKGTESRFMAQDKSEERPCCGDPGWEVSKTIKERLVYRFRDGTYQHVEGTNPVPEI